MNIRHTLLAAALFAGLLSSDVAMAGPLFESDETLAVVLEMPVGDLLRHAKKKPTVSGKMLYKDADGSDVILDINVTTRGKSRLEQCKYPPLSINLKKKQAANTEFAGQKKLKLVTPCRDSPVYKRYLAQEYTIYKAYNLLSEYSFRVRMLEVTFRDSNGKRKDEVHAAFFIEPDKQVAARLNMTTVKTKIVRVSQLEPEQLSILTLFQYMIGNTDWSVRRGPDSGECCHNGKVIAPPDSANGWVVLPYDFDQSGIIYTSYSTPHEKLPIRNVRQRLYRGYCRGNDRLDETITRFNDNRAAIEDLFGGASDQPSANKTALKYLGSFYETINDPKKRKKRVIDACQRASD